MSTEVSNRQRALELFNKHRHDELTNQDVYDALQIKQGNDRMAMCRTLSRLTEEKLLVLVKPRTRLITDRGVAAANSKSLGFKTSPLQRLKQREYCRAKRAALRGEVYVPVIIESLPKPPPWMDVCNEAVRTRAEALRAWIPAQMAMGDTGWTQAG